ncbi:phosphatidylglycerol lysyltransferase domain-containing protein [Chryseobacterium sp. R2A-55]|uniref:phosphatidylglycerol lysyltransferase domain-containing protein n=1 Tax=Chryseobacterium sp. R2A-55 TaxID=2744445 RepID=UPI001F17260E|nr:phosphatidylglycerol lysyltransferase domain-containing protein [Chryseobacterium sp. R2A-55]
MDRLKNIISKIRWKEILAVLILFLAFVFFRSEQKEMASIIPQIKQANSLWIVIGILLTFLYVVLQALMYVASFNTVGTKLSLLDGIELFLKRNFLSVFLPAGGISSLAFTPKPIQRKIFDKKNIHKASAIYGFIGIFTVFLVGIPVIGYAAVMKKNFGESWFWLIFVGIFVALVFLLVNSLRTKGILYQLTEKYFPKKIDDIDEIFGSEINPQGFYVTIFISVLIEFCGIFHLLIAMYAFGGEGSFSAAAVGYTISVLLMLVSPFLRGLGAVEFSLIYILANFGFSHSQGLGITLLYRIFEFWLPLVLGIFAFLWHGRKLIARILPAVAIFLLGLINVISVITPPLKERLHFSQLYFSEGILHFSKILTLIAGISLIVTSAYLIRGLKRGWYFAFFLAIVSLAGNLLKALDYEEATVALIIILILVFTRKDYVLKTSRKVFRTGFSWIMGILVALVAFNFLSFYFIDQRHFGIDFTWKQALYYTFQNFLLFKENNLLPKTGFARDFEYLNYFLGLSFWILLIFSLFNVRKIPGSREDSDDFEQARNLVHLFGNSPLDFFKISSEKQLFFSEVEDGFISFRIANNFAVVLEEPVCAPPHKILLIKEFEDYCKKIGIKPIYYRIDEGSLYLFNGLKKQRLFVGQEALMQVDAFKLEGKDRKSLRNGLSSLSKKGYKTEILSAPQNETLLDQIQKISDEWLNEFQKSEMVFSQGMFNREEIRNQDLIVLKNNHDEIEAFLNIIPDFAPQECTYDLIRRTTATPNGSMDAMIVKLVEYAKSKDFKYINLGLTPLGGDKMPDNTAEEILKFVYNRIGSFKHYQSLRDFKQKYADTWENKYLIYGSDFDLVGIPAALNKVMKPAP